MIGGGEYMASKKRPIKKKVVNKKTPSKGKPEPKPARTKKSEEDTRKMWLDLNEVYDHDMEED